MNLISKIFTFLIFLIFTDSIRAQNLSLADLTNICNKKNWEDVDRYLFNKGWAYHSSSKGDSDHYSTVSWAYELDRYSDKASGWVYLYTYDGLPSKVEFNTPNKQAYSGIYNSISSNGYKSIESEIEDDLVTATFSNSNYILEISNAKKSESDSYYSTTTITSYGVRLVKKSSVYDPNNGTKYTYFDNGNIESEYNLKDGKRHGIAKAYYKNGSVNISGNFSNGDASGKVIEFDLDGVKIGEWEMKNDLKNGKQIKYEDSKIKSIENFKDGIKVGEYIRYTFDENGKKVFTLSGSFKDDVEHGSWKYLFHHSDEKDEVVQEFNFIDGYKHGPFKDYYYDTVKIGTYDNGVIEGNIYIYFNFMRELIGSDLNVDTNTLTLIEKGEYRNGLKNGNWKIYDIVSTLRENGNYVNGKKSGEWKYYYSNVSNGKQKLEPYAKKLYLTQNYKNGILEGKSIKYSELEEEKYPCVEYDTCYKTNYLKFKQEFNYKNNELNGEFLFYDSLNKLRTRGYFINGVRNGEWEHYIFNQENQLTEKNTGAFSNGLESGMWKRYDSNDKLLLTQIYVKGKLDGYTVRINDFGKPNFKKLYQNDKLLEYIQFDSTGSDILFISKLIDQYDDYLEVKYTRYTDSTISVSEYKVTANSDAIKSKYFSLHDYLYTTDYNAKLHGNHSIIKRGKIFEEGKYNNEMKDGAWTYYFHDKNVKQISLYRNDELSGETFKMISNEELFSGTFIKQSENIRETIKIKEGLRNGKTIFTDIKTNKKIKKVNYKNGVLAE